MNYSQSIILIIFIGIIIGYLFGSILWSVIIGKLFFKKDPRDFGSKNPGSTNSSRIYGKKVALIILILDISKAIIPIIITWMIAKYAINFNQYINFSFNPYQLVYISGFSATIGHMYPVFFKFKGGKGIATFGGFLICVAPFIALSLLLILISIVLITKYVSLSGLIATILSCFFIFIPGLNYSFILCNNLNEILLINYGSIYWLLFLWAFIVILTVLIWIKHKNNIKALINKTERKYYLFKSNK